MVHSFLHQKMHGNVTSIWNACANSAPGRSPMECLSKRARTFLMLMVVNLHAYWQNPPFFTLSAERTCDTLHARKRVFSDPLTSLT